MITILHTIAGLHPDSGGPARTVTSLCAGLSALPDLDVALLTQGLPGGQVYRGDLAAEKLLLATASSPLLLKSGMAFERMLSKQIARTRPDIIHDHGLWLPSNHLAARAARAHRIPYVLHTRGMLEPWALGYRAGKKKLAWWMYQRRDLASVSAFFATSATEAEHIRELGFGAPIAIIPNGVNLAVSVPSAETGRTGEHQRRVVFMGRIHPKKGLANLLVAWAEVAPEGWDLCLAGPDEGSHLREILGLARDLGLADQLHYLGSVEGAGKYELLNSADVFILPSFSENFGVVVAEALACGVPVITTRGTPWRELSESRCGWWVEADVAGLAMALRAATGMDDSQRREMGRRGRQYASRFDWADIARQTARVYQWLLGRDEMPDCVRLN